MNIVLLGMPGAGKGTQAEYLVKEYGFNHISTGDIFRSILKGSGHPMKATIEGYVTKGLLVPDTIVNEVMKEAVRASKRDFMLDGFPRNIQQAEVLDAFLADIGRKLDAVLYLELPFEEAVKRLTARRVCPNCKTSYNVITIPPAAGDMCGKCNVKVMHRPDDMPETVRERLKVYEKETFPLVDHYSRASKLIRVKADGRIDEITGEIKRKLASF